jgi:hypothetical protein
MGMAPVDPPDWVGSLIAGPVIDAAPVPGNPPRPPDLGFLGRAQGMISPLRSRAQWIESVNDTLKGQLDLERHGGRTTAGVCTRITQRLLAMAAAIWHNWATAEPIKRSLIAYDH